jgi:hypothetical protein
MQDKIRLGLGACSSVRFGIGHPDLPPDSACFKHALLLSFLKMIVQVEG